MPSPFRILVAEDDRSALEAIAVLLEQDGRFAVSGRAGNGLEALNLAKRLKPDAVVMDIEMPVLDGVEATRQLRERRPDLPIVAISGHDYEERVLEIRNAGAHDYVRKARLATELPRVLAAVLGAAAESQVETRRTTKQRILAAVREICLGLPETSERLSHGAPTFFVREKRSFATVSDNHHGDGRFALVCAAPDGLQAALVGADPERFYVPPYVGHRGWIGVRLDRGFDRDEIAGILEDAFAEVAPARLLPTE